MNILDVKNLNLGFNCENGFRQALYNVNFSLEKGKMFALVGESGCGKTMSAMSILQLLPKTAKITGGEIIFDGKNLLNCTQNEMQKIRGAKIALIPQDPMTSLNPLYTVGDQLLEVLKVHQNLEGKKAFQKAIEAFEMVQIPCPEVRLKSYPHEFSGGMKQRAIIAMALCCNAEILIADELQYPETMISNPVRADMISVKGFDGACDKQGNLLPEFVAKVKSRIRNSYSHPSVCMYSFGNEIRDFGPVSQMMNNIYDFFRKWEKQNLPCTPSSGRVYQEATNLDRIRGEKFDYIDTHAYAGTGNEYPLPYVGMMYRHFIRTAEKLFGKDHCPIVNGECVYDGNRYWKTWYDGIWKQYDDPEPDWDKYLACVNEMKQKAREAADLSLYWIRNWGAKNYKYRRSEGFGIYTERVLDYARAAWPKVDGYAALADPYIALPESLGDFSEIRIRYLKAAEGLRKICAPMVGGLERVAPNQFSGSLLKTGAWVVNNHESARSAVRMEITLSREGKTVFRNAYPLGSMKPGDRKQFQLSIPLPGEEGYFRLECRVCSNAGTESERFLDLKLRKKETLYAPLRTEKKIALFDASSVFGSLKPCSTMKVLKQLGIRFDAIEEFRDLTTPSPQKPCRRRAMPYADMSKTEDASSCSIRNSTAGFHFSMNSNMPWRDRVSFQKFSASAIPP